MSVQTTMTAEPAIGLPGQIYDSGVFHDIVTCIAQEDIPFGCWCRINGQYAELPDSTGEVTGKTGGVAVRDPSRPSGVGYKTGDVMQVLKTGRIWITTEQAIGNQVAPFVRFATGTGTQKGAWRADADTATAVALPNAHMYRAAGVGLGVVELGKTGE